MKFRWMQNFQATAAVGFRGLPTCWVPGVIDSDRIRSVIDWGSATWGAVKRPNAAFRVTWVCFYVVAGAPVSAKAALERGRIGWRSGAGEDVLGGDARRGGRCGRVCGSCVIGGLPARLMVVITLACWLFMCSGYGPVLSKLAGAQPQVPIAPGEWVR